ncbi:hypothetical protein [Saccharopolyspora shandongensis]|uniref:hypothetical protein n=1 Tax=Saccharopolyspora shandongensis TaxID=418495 RepID=UPI00340A8512
MGRTWRRAIGDAGRRSDPVDLPSRIRAAVARRRIRTALTFESPQLRHLYASPVKPPMGWPGVRLAALTGPGRPIGGDRARAERSAASSWRERKAGGPAEAAEMEI